MNPTRNDDPFYKYHIADYLAGHGLAPDNQPGLYLVQLRQGAVSGAVAIRLISGAAAEHCHWLEYGSAGDIRHHRPSPVQLHVSEADINHLTAGLLAAGFADLPYANDTVGRDGVHHYLRLNWGDVDKDIRYWGPPSEVLANCLAQVAGLGATLRQIAAVDDAEPAWELRPAAGDDWPGVLAAANLSAPAKIANNGEWLAKRQGWSQARRHYVLTAPAGVHLFTATSAAVIAYGAVEAHDDGWYRLFIVADPRLLPSPAVAALYARLARDLDEVQAAGVWIREEPTDVALLAFFAGLGLVETERAEVAPGLTVVIMKKAWSTAAR